MQGDRLLEQFPSFVGEPSNAPTMWVILGLILKFAGGEIKTVADIHWLIGDQTE